MKIDQDGLISLWGSLKPPSDCAITYTKIGDSQIADLNVGVTKLGSKCLVLVLPPDLNAEAHTRCSEAAMDLKNIELYLHDRRELVLVLKDDFYFGEFLDFTLTLIPKIFDADKDASSFIFLSTVAAWLEMFESISQKGLSDSALRGLLGELIVLNYQIHVSELSVNDILEGWRGPYHFSKDFDLGSSYIEVKYKDEAKNSIKVSSEFQLDAEPKKPVFLAVVSGNSDAIKGNNLSEICSSIRQVIRKKNGNIRLFLTALKQMGVTVENISSFDHIRIKFSRIDFYDTSISGFPSIQKKHLQPGISKVTYDINTSLLGRFIRWSEEL
ncbi:PD-(D/E)XK motif protein [Porticoccaceae bacterium]|nr:PD-(D/E)XK motif protein [Porticoccaceae bacterium]MDC1477251.1 PD-(D/E)XK motif protein [Porticoccaceae bacterium]